MENYSPLPIEEKWLNFFEKNKIQPHQKVIAMGDATAMALNKLKIKDNLAKSALNWLFIFLIGSYVICSLGTNKDIRFILYII